MKKVLLILRRDIQDKDELRLKKLEFAHAITPLENPMSIRPEKGYFARLKTELKKKGNSVNLKQLV